MIRALSALLAALVLGAPRPAGAEGPATPPRDAGALLDEAYRRKAAGDAAGAAAAFSAALAAGADRQRVSLELAYLAAARGDVEAARRRFEDAAAGPDAELAGRARAELRLLPAHFWGDLYAEAFGWTRVVGAQHTTDLVPTLRVRALYRPVLSADFNLYASLQITRDLGSLGAGSGGLPVIYADDYAIAGLGILARFWERRIGVFAQVGPALDLLDAGERVVFDARGGVFFGAETAGCAPDVRGVSLVLVPCLEGYGEAVYVSRFDNNIIAFGRARAAVSYLVTGPVAWQWVVEGRAAKDRNDDYYNNFADAGAGHRFRLLRPLRLDLMFGVHAGGYFGVQNRDPAPRQLDYVDLRVQAATYMEL